MIAAQTQTADPSVTQGEIVKLRAMMMAMPLQQLQAFAQQYMTGPNGGIIVGLASQIANAKKSAQAPQQQPQGTVAQQDIQAIAPENQGIGQLPARNIEGMAAGGIVGYADGGHVGGRMEDGERRFDVAGLVPNQSLLGDIPMYDTTPLLPTQTGAPENNKVPFLRQLYRDYMTRRADPTNPNNNFFGRPGAPTPAPVLPAVTNPTDARLAAGVQQPPGGIADLAAAIPDTDPKTKAPPKVTDAKKEGTVASNGLYDLLDNKGTAYKGLTLDDINRSVSLAQSNAPSATDLYNQANSLAKEKDAAAKAEYKPLQDLSDAEHKRLQNRNDNAFANALIMGSLAGMNSRNIGEFFEKAGKVGGESYIHDKDYADAAERDLMKSDLATKQALDARLNNNERDAQTYMHLSDTQKQNAIANTMAAYGLADKSQYQAGELGIRGQLAGLEGIKVKMAQDLQPFQKNLMSAQANYYNQRGMGMTGRLNMQQLAQVDKQATADMQKWRAQPENMLKSDEEAQAYYQQRAEAHAATLGTTVPSSGTVVPAAAPASTSGFKLLGSG